MVSKDDIISPARGATSSHEFAQFFIAFKTKFLAQCTLVRDRTTWTLY